MEKTMSDVKKITSDVGKIMSDVGKITSDLFYAVENCLKADRHPRKTIAENLNGFCERISHILHFIPPKTCCKQKTNYICSC